MSVCLFSFVPLLNAQHVNSEVHNVLVLVGISFEIHMKMSTMLDFIGQKKSVIRTLNVTHLFH